jgi:hypothetical protein
MKLNATYSLATGTVLTPGYLAPTFDILSDDSSVLTSSSSIQNSASSAAYSGVDAGHRASVAPSIIMDLGSLKTVSTVKLNCKFQINYGVGTIQLYPTFYSMPGNNTSDPGLDTSIIYRFVPGKASVYNTTGSLAYILKSTGADNATGCLSAYSGAVGDVEAAFTNKFFGGVVSAAYKVQYGVTSSAFFDLENTTVTTPLDGMIINKTINIPSSIGNIRYLKLVFSGYTINKNVLTLLPTTSNTSAKSTLIKYQSFSVGSSEFGTNSSTQYTDAINITSTVDTIYSNVNNIFIDGSYFTVQNNYYWYFLRAEYSSSYSGPWTTLATTSLSRFLRKIDSPISSGYIRLMFYSPGSYSSALTLDYCGLGISGSKCAVASLPIDNIATTSSAESIIDGSILLYNFYADDGAVPSVITIISPMPSTTTVTNGSVSLTAAATVTQGGQGVEINPTYQWQKKEVGASSFVNIPNATSSSLLLTGLTNSADNGDQYQAVVSATGANSVTSNVTTLSVPSAPVAYSLSSLINNTPALLYNNQINEGQTLLININASKAPETFNSQSLILYWKRINSGTSASDSDFTNAVPGGSIVMSPVGILATPQSFTGQLTLNPTADQLTEGNENFIIALYDDNGFTNEVSRSPIFTILDTSTGGVAPAASQTPTPPVTPTPTKPTPSSTKDEQGCFIVPVKLDLTQTPTTTQTGTPTTTPTSTPDVTPPHTPLSTQTPTRTRTPFATSTPTNQPTNTPRLSQTPTNTRTPTQTPTQTPTNTITPTNTGTSAATPTPTPTSTVTKSQTPSATATPGPTATQTGTPAPTPTASITPSISVSGPPCEGPVEAAPFCPPCNSTIIIGYNEFIDPRCGLYRIPIYECVYIPNCGQ